jgi:MIP family channel proteins
VVEHERPGAGRALIEREDVRHGRPLYNAPMPKGLMRELLAEFFGTFILIVFGVGVVAQVVLSKHTAGDTLSINIAWGLAVTMGCYVSAGVSGAHLNPAVTLALAVHRKLPWGKVLPYSIAQLAGAFVASAVVYVTYHEALNAFDGGVRQVVGAQATAGIWATYPQAFLSTFPGGFIDQVVGTALLVAGIFGITDSRNSPAPAGLAPVVVGLLVLLIGATFGFNAGYAINPARDVGPRLFTFVAGWGGEVFRAGNAWWWVPIVAPCVGGVLGGWVYDACVGHRFPTAG